MLRVLRFGQSPSGGVSVANLGLLLLGSELGADARCAVLWGEHSVLLRYLILIVSNINKQSNYSFLSLHHVGTLCR